jgi:hypothetical protein
MYFGAFRELLIDKRQPIWIQKESKLQSRYFHCQQYILLAALLAAAAQMTYVR